MAEIPDNLTVLSPPEAKALRVLRSWNGNSGWLAPVTITVSVGINQHEALTQTLEALETLGIHVRPAMRGDAG
jgi:hypothetical protein